MIPVTGTQIISAVCRALRAKYADIPIYKEAIDQDFKEPCFYVWNSKTDTSPMIWPKYRETHSIEVRYYPPQRNNQNGEGLDMGAELVEVLSKIRIRHGEEESLPIYATNYSRNIVDDAVAVSITYTTEGYFYEERAESMGDFNANIGTKE